MTSEDVKNMTRLALIVWKEQREHGAKHLLLSSTEESYIYRFGDILTE